MNGWTWVILAADVIGVVCYAVGMMPNSLAIRRILLSEAGLTAGLIALIALQAANLGVGGVLALVSMSFTAGFGLRIALAINHFGNDTGSFGAKAGVVSGILAVFVVAIVGFAAATAPKPPLRPPPNTIPPDSA